MRKIEDYWKDFENYGFIKEAKEGRIDYKLDSSKGRGGFSVLGDPSSAMAVISDCTLFRPFIIKEYVNEKVIEIGEYYTGSASYYQKKDEVSEFEYGLNAYVNHTNYYGYKRIEANIRLFNISFGFREKFFSSLSIELEAGFFEKAAAVLNSAPIIIPKITSICNSLKELNLEGRALRLYIEAKALEVFSLLYDYIYKAEAKSSIFLSAEDKAILSRVKSFIEENFASDFTILELTKKFALNQQKLVTGFKDLYNTTINGYTRKIRMTKAMELLYDTDLKIAEIAKKVGYCGDGYFQKAFKEAYGITPKQMRKDIQSSSFSQSRV